MNFLRKNKKKGMSMALESLLGVVLSIIILFLVISLFASTFLETPTNLKIAKGDAESIKDFVDFSSKTFKNYNVCYTTLKLINLENYQFDEKDKNYFYVIDNNGINVINLKYYNDFLEKKSLKDKTIPINYEKKFEKPVNIVFDDTSEGGAIAIPIYVGTFAQTSIGLDLKSEDKAQEIILKPVFAKKTFDVEVGVGDYYIPDNQNGLLGSTLYDEDNEDSPDEESAEGFALVYNPQMNTLFLAKSAYTLSVINPKICNVLDYQNEVYTSLIADKPELADFINQEYYFDAEIDKVLQNYIFKWSLNGVECPADFDDCNSLKNLNYNQFLEKLRDIYKTKFNINSAQVLKVRPIKKEDLNANDLRNVNLQNFDFKQVFKKYEPKISVGDQSVLESKLRTISEEEAYQELKEEREDYDGCSSYYCDYFFFKGQNVFFYSGIVNDFVSFDTKYLRKDTKGNLYFLGRKISYKDAEEYDDINDDIFHMAGDKKVQILYFDVEGKKFIAVLSMAKFASIPEDIKYG